MVYARINGQGFDMDGYPTKEEALNHIFIVGDCTQLLIHQDGVYYVSRPYREKQDPVTGVTKLTRI